MSRRRPLVGPNDPRHGRYSTYANHRCRCELCTIAWRDHCRVYQRRKYGHLPQEIRNAIRALEASAHHGTEGTYKRCKCDDCRKAANEARQTRRLRERKAA